MQLAVDVSLMDVHHRKNQASDNLHQTNMPKVVFKISISKFQERSSSKG